MGVQEHKNCVPRTISMGVISISTTRSIENDESGKWIVENVRTEGHTVLVHKVVKKNKKKIKEVVFGVIAKYCPNALLLTGGTGLTLEDVTIEALVSVFSKQIPGFAYMFTQLSYEQISSAAIMSRATAGIIGHTAVFCMPGSKNACKLACKKLIFPELTHIVSHITQDLRSYDKKPR